MATALGRNPGATTSTWTPSLVLGVTACAALAVVLRVPYASVPIGVDEGGVAAIARQWPEAHGSLYGAAWLDRPPLLVLAYKAANVWGPIGIRGLGALAAVALVALVALLAAVLGGRRAAVPAAAIGALLSGSGALRAVYTPAELLAAVPSTASVLCLVLAHRTARARWLVAAGALAVGAALVKQSFLDAGLAGAAFLVAIGVARRRIPWRSIAAYGAGAALPVALVVAWQLRSHPAGGGLAYALFGFRVAGLHTLAHSNVPLAVRIRALSPPAWRSGLVLPLAAAPVGLARLRRDRVVCAVLCAWLLGALIGVAAGGSYWPHYWIQLVPLVSVAGAVVLAATSRPVRAAAVVAMATAGLVAAVAAIAPLRAHEPHRGSMVAGEWLQAHARRGDTQYVLYARANVGYYSGLPSPYPYAWSLMVRTIPGAIGQLDRLLASPRRPTWIVRWQPPSIWGLDPRHRTQRLLVHDYVRVAHAGGHPILLRRDVAARRGMLPPGAGHRL